MSRGDACDVAVIGAGAVGAATASALVRAGYSVALVEAKGDVGAGTSKANTAIWHTGFDAKPGTVEAGLVARGHRLLEEHAERFGWAIERTGAVLVAWDAEQLARLDAIVANARAVGYERVVALRADEVRAREPHLGPGALGGLLVPDEGLLDPWSIVIGLATDAVANGASLHLRSALTAVRRDAGHHLLELEGARHLRARWVVNAAGLGSDRVDRLMGHDGFTITPRRGELVVFDAMARRLVRHVILPVPTPTTKGVLVSPTVYGNVLLGPTADDIDDRDATGTTADGIARLMGAGRRIMPALLDEEVTATYAGLRAASEHVDYQLAVFADDRYVRAGGIRSTGITASMAIAERIVAELAEAGETREPLRDAVTPRVPPIAESQLRPYADAARIAADPRYGRIVCACARTTQGEIDDALAAIVPATDVDGLRRRTRALTGRCQGFFCGAEVERRIAEAGDRHA